MFYRKLFLFLLLFSFFVLEVDYKTENVLSHKNNWLSVSLDWTRALALPDLSEEQIKAEEKAREALSKQSTTNSTSTTVVTGDNSSSSLKKQSALTSNQSIGKQKESSDTNSSVVAEFDCEGKTKIGEINGIISELSSELGRESRSDSPSDLRKWKRKCIDVKIELEKIEKKEEQCKEEEKKIKEAEFGKACAQFARGMDCVSAIKACAMCPAPEEDDEEDFSSYNCVSVHQKTKCPILSGKDLELAKEKRDKFQEEVKEMEEDISELEKDIVEKQNELNKSLAELEEEFTSTVADFERETENAKEDLEAELNENKAGIKAEVAKQIAQVQEVLDKSLEIAHSFENAVTEANMKYRAEVKKVYAECSVQAQSQLAKYRSKRRQAIESGTYRVSLSFLTNKNRITFAQKDALLLKKYYRECLVLRKSDLKDLKTAYQQKLRVIAQQKEQYQHRMNLLKQKVSALNNTAYEQQNQLVQEYANRMAKIMSQHASQYGAALKNYNKNKQTLLAETSQINVLQKQLMEKRKGLEQKKRELVTEQQVISYLKSKGVPDEEDDNHGEYAEAAGALEAHYNAVQTAYDSCECESVKKKPKDKDKNKWNAKICKTIKRQKNSLGDDLDSVVQKLSPTTGTR